VLAVAAGGLRYNRVPTIRPGNIVPEPGVIQNNESARSGAERTPAAGFASHPGWVVDAVHDALRHPVP
jgi:hypothetical protein